MTQAELRKYIVTILLDVRGDDDYPSDQVLQANASLLLAKVNQHVAEVIGEDEKLEGIEPDPDCGITRDDFAYERNVLRAEQRKRAGLKDA